MTWKLINQNPTVSNARDVIPINESCSHLAKLGINPKILGDGEINLTRQALMAFKLMTDFDKKNVIKDIKYVIKNPNSACLVKHKANPFWRIARNINPFKNYHFMIIYRLTDSGTIVIEDIVLDTSLHGRRVESKHQRTLLYDIEKVGKARYSEENCLKKDVQNALEAWNANGSRIVPKINREHVAVNGMNNDYNTAAKLMGVHTDIAYQDDNVAIYNLFHNPTDGAGYDLVECLFDKTRIFKSRNSQQLASLILKAQSEKRKVKWTVHSQGAIIFRSALEQVLLKRPGLSLEGHELAVHAPGSHYSILSILAKSLRMNVQKLRANPGDFVPNIIAFNGITSLTKLKLSSNPDLIRACLHSTTEGGSPHTLPYLGLRTYERQLRELGLEKRANLISKYEKKGKY
ncbi:hypothetical protein L3I75_001067 [Vibrio vulnificus]|nr:hypothetical protein [Vibrio vulnificus]EIU7861984.1 hypothetical protein [Vibrio vulnificus]